MARNNDCAAPWERVVPPLWWAQAGMYVVADRHLPDGTRQHMVQGSVVPGLVIANAEVVGEADAPDAQRMMAVSRPETLACRRRHPDPAEEQSSS